MSFQNRNQMAFHYKIKLYSFYVICKNNFLSLNAFKMLCEEELYKSGVKIRNDKRGTDLIAEKLKAKVKNKWHPRRKYLQHI